MAEATVSHLSWTEQPLAPGNFDKAWNDPPLFSYSVSSTPQAGGSRLLTKRVGFPSSHPPPPGQDPTAPPKLHDTGAKPTSQLLQLNRSQR